MIFRPDRKTRTVFAVGARSVAITAALVGGGACSQESSFSPVGGMALEVSSPTDVTPIPISTSPTDPRVAPSALFSVPVAPYFCSDAQVASTGSTVLGASGVTAHLFQLSSVSTDPMYSSVQGEWKMATVKSAGDFRKEILSSGSISIDLSGAPAGNYALFLCDVASDANCTFAAGDLLVAKVSNLSGVLLPIYLRTGAPTIINVSGSGGTQVLQFGGGAQGYYATGVLLDGSHDSDPSQRDSRCQVGDSVGN